VIDSIGARLAAPDASQDGRRNGGGSVYKYKQTDVDDLRIAQSGPATPEGQAALDRLLGNLGDYMICAGMSFLGTKKPEDKDYPVIVADAVASCYDRLRNAIASGRFVHSSSAQRRATGGNGGKKPRKCSRLHTYVYKAVVNATIDVLRARGRRHHNERAFSEVFPDGCPDLEDPSCDVELLRDDGPDTEHGARANVCRGLAAMMAGVRRFREEAKDTTEVEIVRQYQVFQMRSQLGLEYGDIVDRLGNGIKPGNARVKHHRAVQRVLIYGRDYLLALCGGDAREADDLARRVFASLLPARDSDGRKHVQQFMDRCLGDGPDAADSPEGPDGEPDQCDEDRLEMLEEAYAILESSLYRVASRRLASRSSAGQTT
jgi:DNA-directed RNA polymerase specialized sigma24 family protein